MHGKFISYFQAAERNCADGPPAGIGRFKNIPQNLPGFGISFVGNGPWIRIFKARLCGLDHFGQHADGLQDIRRFKTGYHTGRFVFFEKRPIGIQSDNNRHMAG